MMIRYQLTEQEVVEGLLKHRRLQVRPWLAIVMAALGVVLISWNYHSTLREMGFAFYFGCWLVGLAVLSLAIHPLTARRVYTKIVRTNPAFTAPKEIWFDADKLTSVSSTQKIETTWAYFKKITEDENHYYLHHDDRGNVALMPKRAFDAESQREFLKCSQSAPRA